MELAQLGQGFELEPSKAELKGFSKELANSKTRVQALDRPLLRSDDPTRVNAGGRRDRLKRAEADFQAAKKTGREPGGVRDQQHRDTGSRCPGALRQCGQQS
jgi:hypothetical protein